MGKRPDWTSQTFESGLDKIKSTMAIQATIAFEHGLHFSCRPTPWFDRIQFVSKSQAVICQVDFECQETSVAETGHMYPFLYFSMTLSPRNAHFPSRFSLRRGTASAEIFRHCQLSLMQKNAPPIAFDKCHQLAAKRDIICLSQRSAKKRSRKEHTNPSRPGMITCEWSKSQFSEKTHMAVGCGSKPMVPFLG